MKFETKICVTLLSKIRDMKIKVLLLMFAWTLSWGIQAQKTSISSQQARKIFDEVYQKVYGPQGASLHYKVDIVGIYKTEGTIWYKGKKSRNQSSNSKSWNDGVVAYLVKEKKNTVEIFTATSSKQSRFGDDFKFEPENYTYQMESDGNDMVLILKGKKGTKSMKEIRAYLDKKTRTPHSLRIKVAFFWVTVEISDLKSDGISDEIFVFPRKKYNSYEFIDRRGEN